MESGLVPIDESAWLVGRAGVPFALCGSLLVALATGCSNVGRVQLAYDETCKIPVVLGRRTHLGENPASHGTQVEVYKGTWGAEADEEVKTRHTGSYTGPVGEVQEYTTDRSNYSGGVGMRPACWTHKWDALKNFEIAVDSGHLYIFLFFAYGRNLDWVDFDYKAEAVRYREQ